jgi:FkbM family methyltransferase
MRPLPARLRRLLPTPLRAELRYWREVWFDDDFLKTYAQESEDLILHRVFEQRASGFYVDIGAHHPRRFSNTHFFYQRGWRGINIDAMPGCMRLFRRVRPRDINLECAITENGQPATLLVFDDLALNTFDAERAQAYIASGYRIVERREVVTERLADVLRKWLPQGCAIDFMSIDVEGLELQVLRSNDWQNFSPGYVLVEYLGLNSVSDAIEAEVSCYLVDQGYELFAKTANTLIFRAKPHANDRY